MNHSGDFENTSEKPEEKPIEVPPELLSEEALAGIIESFILREGTDYGSVEVGHEKKIEQIRKQIERGDVKIVFDQASETVSLLTKAQFLSKLSTHASQ